MPRTSGRGLRKGRLTALGSPSARWTHVHVDDVARYLAVAVDEPRAVGRRIDIGTDRPVSARDIAEVFAGILGRDIAVRSLPWPLLNGLMRLVGLFSERARDGRAMIEYFHTGSVHRRRRGAGGGVRCANSRGHVAPVRRGSRSHSGG